ncbi:unnamed protein product, partial [Laminaria digitata]
MGGQIGDEDTGDVSDSIGEELEYGSLVGVRIIRGPSLEELKKRKHALEKWNSLETAGDFAKGAAGNAKPCTDTTPVKTIMTPS